MTNHKKENATTIESKYTQLAEILDRISDGFVALDKNWCYIYVNKKAGEILDRNPNEMIGKNMWDEFPALKEEPLDLYNAYMQASKEQKTISIEKYYAPLINGLIPSYILRQTGISIYFKDITNKKRSEAASMNCIQENGCSHSVLAKSVTGDGIF